MSVFKDIRDALYDLVDGIDVNGVLPFGWEMKSKYPPKQLTYPGFWVEPMSNTTQPLDSCTNEATYTFSVSVVESYEDAATGEDTTIELADLVYRSILSAVKDETPLSTGVIDGNPTGQWGFDERYGQRVYRIDVAIRVLEELDP